MRPYKRLFKPVRKSELPSYENRFGKRIVKPVITFWRDLHIIWSEELRFPASIRVLISLVLFIWIVILPIIYFTLPFIFTVNWLYFIHFEEFIVDVILPLTNRHQMKAVIFMYKELFRNLTFRLSIFGIFYDYFQTIRKFGIFHIVSHIRI
ncbi:hypothetical protein RN001_002407 [Aquatica leii]|uniref:Uncharacterized protein n=1 Tax=Aquatica leii TaxID=1421715 RepID=A0AAN7PMC3_9COLE|nr:hypothetical protein RN001_002407 [Aquatica leii]